MTALLAVLALGFFLGMRHATDADHVIAVTTIVSRHRSARSAALIGGLWGLGHTLTILVIGGGIVVFRWVIPPRVGLSMEFAVGVMLIVLGVMNLTGALERISESARAATGAEEQAGALSTRQAVRPLVVGVVHGLAGSAAVALLVLATIQSATWALLYLVIFGIGTIVGMMLMTAAIGVPLALTGGAGFGRVNRGLRWASGVVSLAFGLFIAYRIGIVDGLFASQPVWSPR